MRQPKLATDMYHKLKREIEHGIYPFGSFLPNEAALAEKMGISRNTLRSVLTRLADENLIERISSKGTRVCVQPVVNNQVITLLLPCLDFFTSEETNESVCSTRLLLNGIAQIAFEHKFRVETVPVSPTNRIDDIDWPRLDFIHAGSLVVVFGHWYNNIFPLLLERGCKVVFINQQGVDGDITPACAKIWSVITLNRQKAVEAAVCLLAERGSRKIALAHDNLEEKGHPVLLGYKNGLAQCGLNYHAWTNLLDGYVPADYQETINLFGDFYRQHHFDAIILDAGLLAHVSTNAYINRSLGFPDEVKVISTSDASLSWRLVPSLTCFNYHMEEVGRLAARQLTTSPFQAGKFLVEVSIAERESTMLNGEIRTERFLP